MVKVDPRDHGSCWVTWRHEESSCLVFVVQVGDVRGDTRYHHHHHRNIRVFLYEKLCVPQT